MDVTNFETGIIYSNTPHIVNQNQSNSVVDLFILYFYKDGVKRVNSVAPVRPILIRMTLLYRLLWTIQCQCSEKGKLTFSSSPSSRAPLLFSLGLWLWVSLAKAACFLSWSISSSTTWHCYSSRNWQVHIALTISNSLSFQQSNDTWERHCIQENIIRRFSSLTRSVELEVKCPLKQSRSGK